jgi:acetoacetyl-CoA reductase
MNPSDSLASPTAAGSTAAASSRSKNNTTKRGALVTGGTVGIGAASAEALFAAGYLVAVNYGHHHAAADEFSTRTGIPVFSRNVADLQACSDGMASVQDTIGPIDVLVDNAGITHDNLLHKMTAELWREVIDVDLTGCFNMCRVLIEGMRDCRYGRIVNISSVNGQSGQAGQTNYAAAKAGMIGFTKSLALEAASRNITVNAIASGYTDTSLVAAVKPDVMTHILEGAPTHRLATATEIARCVVFLAAAESGFITGITLSINGGKYMA